MDAGRTPRPASQRARLPAIESQPLPERSVPQAAPLSEHALELVDDVRSADRPVDATADAHARTRRRPAADPLRRDAAHRAERRVGPRDEAAPRAAAGLERLA